MRALEIAVVLPVLNHGVCFPGAEERLLAKELRTMCATILESNIGSYLGVL